jgi:hyperpolarization activated cyclic nucleotide-gated potassium channel 2
LFFSLINWYCSSILIGDLLKAVFIGVASSMMQMMDASRRLYMEKLNTVTEYMEFKKLPSYTRGRLLEYYENRYQGKMFDEEKVLATLNPILRRALVRHNRKDLAKKVPFFDDCPSHFIDEILNVMRLEMYLKNDKIIRQGTSGQKMFFIQSGVCLIILGNKIKRKRKSLGREFSLISFYNIILSFKRW